MEGKYILALIILIGLVACVGSLVYFTNHPTIPTKTVTMNATVTMTTETTTTRTVAITTVTQTKWFEPDDYDWSKNVTVPPFNQTIPP